MHGTHLRMFLATADNSAVLRRGACRALSLRETPRQTRGSGKPAKRYAKVRSILFRTDLFQAHLENWELILQERTVEAIERIASVPGVAGVILGGSVGRGMAWPISDIDLIYITTRVADNSLPKRVDELALSITREWARDTWPTSVDAGRLHFTADEADDLIKGKRHLDELMANERTFHATDKSHLGQSGHASEDCDTPAFVVLLSDGRFDPSVVRARQIERVRRVTSLAQRVQSHLEAGSLIEAGISIQELARVIIPYLHGKVGAWRSVLWQGFHSFLRSSSRAPGRRNCESPHSTVLSYGG